MISNSTANAFRTIPGPQATTPSGQAAPVANTAIGAPLGTQATRKSAGSSRNGLRPKGVVRTSRNPMSREKIVKKVLAQPGFTKPTAAAEPENHQSAFDATSISTWSEMAWDMAGSAKNWMQGTWDSARKYYLLQRETPPKVCPSSAIHASGQCGLAPPDRKSNRPAQAFIDDAHASHCNTQISPSLAARLAKDARASLDGTIVFVADIGHGDQQTQQEMEELILRHYEGGSILGDVAPDDMLVESGRHCRAIYWRHWNPLGGACNKIDDEALKDRIFDKYGPPFEQAAAEVLRLNGQPVPDGFYERAKAIEPYCQEAYSTPIEPEKKDACAKAWNILQEFMAEVHRTMAERDHQMLGRIRELAFDADGTHIDNKVIWFTIGRKHWDSMKHDLMAIGDVLYVEKDRQK